MPAAVLMAGAVMFVSFKANAEPMNPPRHGIPEPCSLDGSIDAIEAIRTRCSSGISLRILPLGDSITQANMMHHSYRYYLWVMLTDADIDFDFVGSMNRNNGGNPRWPPRDSRSFDSDHEGHWGWSTDQILYGLPDKRDERLSEWLKTYTPDIALIHLGTNDVLQSESAFSTTNELREIIKTLRKDNQQVIVLLAKLIPVLDARMKPPVDELNARFDMIAIEMSTSTSPIIVVDQNSGLNAATDMYDWLHPNGSGDLKMAAKWFDALQDVLGR